MMESGSSSCVRPSELFGCNAELQQCDLDNRIGSKARCHGCAVFVEDVRVVRAARCNGQAAELAGLFASHGVQQYAQAHECKKRCFLRGKKKMKKSVVLKCKRVIFHVLKAVWQRRRANRVNS